MRWLYLFFSLPFSFSLSSRPGTQALSGAVISELVFFAVDLHALQAAPFFPLLALVKTFGVARLRHLRITVIGLRLNSSAHLRVARGLNWTCVRIRTAVRAPIVGS